MADYFKGLNQLFADYANDIEQNAKEELSWTDNLKNEVQVTAKGDSLEISMPLYGWVVEKGRRGFAMPPTKPLIPWIEKKFGVSEEEAEDLAYPVALSIYRSSRLARPWVDKAIKVDVLTNQIATLIVKNMIREIEVTSNQGMFLPGRIPHNKKTM